MAKPLSLMNPVEGKSMSNALEQTQQITPTLEPQVVESVLLSGDLAKLNPPQRVAYYRRVCESLGLNYLTQPFAYLHLNNKLQLYARRECAEQLRKLHRISLSILSTTAADSVYEVRVRATMPDGRVDEDMGATSILNLRNDALVNARLKAVTKAKRRVTLSICGLGWLDESEIESIPDARQVHVNPETGEIDPKNEALKSVMDMANDVPHPDAQKQNGNGGKLSDPERADILIAFDSATTIEELAGIRNAALRRAKEVSDKAAYDQFERIYRDIKKKWLGSNQPDDMGSQP